MRKLLEKRADWFLVGLLLILVSLRFVGLAGGLVLGEPDEFIHQSVVDNFRRSLWPEYGGVPWFFQMPVYPLFGFWLSPIFSQKYVALRLVSVVASLLLILGTYLFFRYRFSRRRGFLAALLLTLSPFSIYISRLALLDSTAIAFGLLSVYAFEVAWQQRSKKWSIFSGLLLTVALMTKYTALIFFLPLPIFWFYSLIKENWSDFRRGNSIKLDLISTLTILVVLFLTWPVLYLMRQHEPYFFKLQTLTSLGFIRDFWRIKGGELNILVHLGNMPWWLTWPILILFPFGLLILLGREIKRLPAFSLSLLITLIIVLPFRPFYPRYFYPLVPFIAILSASALDRLMSKLVVWQRCILCLLTVALMWPTAWEAFRSTQHTLIERAGSYVADRSQEFLADAKPWLLTNYWPNIVGAAAQNDRSTWLTTSPWDASAFVPGVKESPLNLLEKEGGFVLLEELYSHSKMFIHPPQRSESWAEVERRYRPVSIIRDDSPNFPHFLDKSNQVAIYRVERE